MGKFKQQAKKRKFDFLFAENDVFHKDINLNRKYFFQRFR